MRDDMTEELRAHILRKRRELERLQQAAAAIPQVQRDLESLERALAILRPETIAEQPSQRSASWPGYTGPSESYPHLAQAILRERGVPLTGEQIVQIAQAQGKPVKRTSLMGGIYRCIKEGKLFRLVAPGTFGLLEWENHSTEPDESLLAPPEETEKTGETDEVLYENTPLVNPNGVFGNASVTER